MYTLPWQLRCTQMRQDEPMNSGEAQTGSGYPAGCPLPEAKSAVGQIVFVLCHDVRPEDNGFTPLAQRKTSESEFDAVELCMSMGLSVFVELKKCEKLRKLRPGLGDKVAFLTLDRGLIMRTGKRPGHHTWWPPFGDSCCNGFTIFKKF